jgi:hypothetical protein
MGGTSTFLASEVLALCSHFTCLQIQSARTNLSYSRYLAGHPEKFMLIDIFDAASEKQIGEFGWGGFKLYPAYISYSRELIQAK